MCKNGTGSNGAALVIKTGQLNRLGQLSQSLANLVPAGLAESNVLEPAYVVLPESKHQPAAAVVAGFLQGGKATATFKGDLGPVPVDFDLTFEYEGVERTITVTLTIREPLPFTYSYKFNLDANDSLRYDAMAAAPLPAAPAVAPFAFNVGCAVICLGTAAYGILRECLGSFGKPDDAFLDCVLKEAQNQGGVVFGCVTECI